MRDDWSVLNLRLAATCLWASGFVLALGAFAAFIVARGTANTPTAILGAIGSAVLVSAALVEWESRKRQALIEALEEEES